MKFCLVALSLSVIFGACRAQEPRAMAIDIPPYNHLTVHVISKSTIAGLNSKSVNEARLSKHPEYVVESREIAYINEVHAAITSLPEAAACEIDQSLSWMMVFKVDDQVEKFFSDGEYVKGRDGKCRKFASASVDFDLVEEILRR